MSINQLKAFIWVASAGVAGFLGWYVYDFFEHKDELSKEVSQEEQLAVLTSIPQTEPPKDDVVDYAIVLKTWHNMNWMPPEPKVAVAKGPEAEGPKKPLYKPVAELLEVTMLQVDGGDPARSMAQVRFLDPSLFEANKSPDDLILKEGKQLTAPYESVRVARITRDGVLFSFEVEEGGELREKELVTPSRMDSGPRIVSAIGREVVKPTKPKIQSATPRPSVLPAESLLIGNDHWLIGVNDRKRMAEDYTGILAELRFEKHRDPKTGKVDGVEIKDVPEGAYAAKYGVKEGQVIKSINGTPISSVNEGISFAKKNQDKYDIWTIVYEEQGKEKTKVIDTSDD